MKYIKYLMLAIASFVMVSGCTDEGPEAILSVAADVNVSVTNVNEATFNVTLDKNDDSMRVIVYLFDEDGKEYTKGLDSEYSNGNVFTIIYSDLEPGHTYTYKVGLRQRGDGWDMTSLMEIASGSFRVPSLEEYLSEQGDAVLEPSVITNSEAVISIKLPKDVCTGNYVRLLYSTSSDFADSHEISIEDGSHKNIISAKLSELQENTKYYVKLRSNFIIIKGNSYYDSDNITLSDYTLTPTPDSFTTLSDGEVISEARAILSASALDVIAQVSISLPDMWEFYREYSNDPYNYQIIISNDQEYKDYTIIADGVSSLWIPDLTPETTYYLALKGDFRCSAVDRVFKDFILPADKAMTTTHANQLEMTDGHACVDLGLSVKWATENVVDGSEEYFAWPEVSGIKDIAGTEYDIATNHWGTSWQMPSEAQFLELLKSCKIYERGNSLIFVGNTGNYIQIETKGFKSRSEYAAGGYYIYDDSVFYYWTSTASAEYRGYANCFYGSPHDIFLYNFNADVIKSKKINSEYTVRPVTTK